MIGWKIRGMDQDTEGATAMDGRARKERDCLAPWMECARWGGDWEWHTRGGRTHGRLQ
jgi:hypothetical protein